MLAADRGVCVRALQLERRVWESQQPERHVARVDEYKGFGPRCEPSNPALMSCAERCCAGVRCGTG